MNLTRRGLLITLAGGCAAACSAALVGCGPAGVGDLGMSQSTFFAFDTVCAVGGILSRSVLSAAVERCRSFEQLFSRTVATSDVGRINAAAGAPTKVSAETVALVSAALDCRAQSNGAFDPTIGAVSELWDFHAGVVPRDADIAAALPHVGVDVRVDADACTVMLDDPVARLDLGGIAKGYIADAVIADLAAAGVASAYVNLGGNVAVLGTKPDNTPWSVGVRDPFASLSHADAADMGVVEGDREPALSEGLRMAGSSVGRISVSDASVVTSGLYERSFELDGRRYWHILDPRSGYPVNTDLASVTVVAGSSLDADGYAKPPFFLGVDAALKFLACRGFQGLVVTQDGAVCTTPGSGFSLA